MKRIRLNLTGDELAMRLLDYRKKHNLTQWEMVVEKFKNQIALRTYCSWESGEHQPRSQIYLSKLKEVGII